MSNNDWNEQNTIDLLNSLNINNDIVYTDIENKYGNIKFKYKKPLNAKIKNMSPNRKKENIITNEILYSNIYLNTKDFFIKRI